MATASDDEVLPCDLLKRLLGCDSGDCDPAADLNGGEADEDTEGRPEELFDEAAARAACVMGI